MVDVRPLVFANVLALMLLLTAGFAHISNQDDLSGSTMPTANVIEPSKDVKVANNSTPTNAADNGAVTETPPVQAIEVAQPTSDEPELNDKEIFADTFQDDTSLTESTDNALVSADASITEAGSTQVDKSTEPEPSAVIAPVVLAPIETPAPAPKADVVKATPKPKPKPVATTGTLIIRSNIEGDMVLINGKPYGPTRLEVELDPGNYAVEVAKSGYSSWQADVSVIRGKKQTLKAKLEQYTAVDYKNGEWINGITTGEGSYLADDGIHYQGAFVNGKFHGIGSISYPDGTEYRGQWFEGVMQGDGTLLTNQGDTFIGIFKDGEFNGEGTLTKSNGDIYNGYWVNGSLNGQGSLTTKDGLLYVGGFSENQFHGDGSLTYPDGRHYEGSFSKGQFHGKGVEIYANGKKYAGQFMEGKYHGKGELMNPNGSKITGTFKFGLPFGKATLTTPEGEIFTARTTEPGVCYRLKSYRATQCPPMEGW